MFQKNSGDALEIKRIVLCYSQNYKIMKPIRDLIKIVFFTIGIMVTIGSLSLPLYSQQAGTIDSTFGNNGVVFCETDFNPYATFLTLMDAQERILTVSTIDNDSNLLIVRNLPNGSLDPDFGINGQVIYSVTRIYISSMIIQEDGKILVAASGCQDSCDILTSDNYDFFIIRFLQDGYPDTAFGDQGLVKVNLGQNEFTSGMVVQDDGKILVTGRINYGEFSDIILIRLLSEGKPDSTFGAAGIVSTDLNSLYPYFIGGLLALQPDGKIIVVAKNFDQFGDLHPSAILRYDSNGILDHSFGSNGVIDSTYSSFDAIDIQYDGAILLAGGWCSWGCGMVLSKYTSSGHLDSAFSDHGQFASYGGRFMAIKTQTDHKILTTGYWPGNLFLMRFTPEGHPDTTFALMGTSLTPYGDLSFSGNKIYIQPDGKIMVVGVANGNKVFIARYYNDINTSIKNESTAKQINVQVYPNPASNFLTVACTEMNNDVVVTITDISGKIHYKNTASQIHTLQVDTHDFSEGLYFVQIQTENIIQTKKIFISK